MRYGIMSDIHANYPALEVMLRCFEDQGVDQLLCAGDIVGFGPQPNECIERLVELSVVAIAGNHDLMVVGRLEENATSDRVKQSSEWTRSVVGADGLQYLHDLPLTTEVHGIRLAHGSLASPVEYVTTAAQAGEQLERLRRTSARVLVLGHTHRQMAYSDDRMVSPPRTGGAVPLPATPILVNPGSVGQSRQFELRPRVRGATLDWPGGFVRFHSLAYEVGQVRDLLRAHDLPASSAHLRPGRAGYALRRLTESWPVRRAARVAHLRGRARRRRRPPAGFPETGRDRSRRMGR
jgi:putative phosphoesterase